MIGVIKTLLVVYVCFAALMTIFQRSFIYFPTTYDAYPINELSAKNVNIYSANGMEWLWLPSGQSPRHILVYFHGNAMSAIDRIDKAEEWRKRGFDVMLVEYPGFGPREGKPSEQAFYETGRQVLSTLKQDFPKTSLSLYGESLGSATAVQMATEFDIQGLILETPFLSVKRIAQGQYPFLPVSILLRDKFLNDKKINQIQAPLFIIHGTEDSVVPFSHGETLYNLYEGQKTFYPINGASHNDLYSHPDIQSVLDDISMRAMRLP
jgi:pimeloyl-ACP methyl ester carboxylesterase